jgi:hypothetical protein
MPKEEILYRFKNEFQEGIYKKNAYFYLQGKYSDVLFNAHIDTVKTDNGFNIKQYEDFIYNRNSILGADDRAGVWIAYNLAKAGASILLTDFEESTKAGVNAFCRDFKDVNHKLFIGLDRRGFKEFVNYGYADININRIFTKMGFKEKIGSYSDVLKLTEKFSRFNVNLSVGFYSEHSKDEYLSLSSMNYTLNKCFKLLTYQIPDIKTDDYLTDLDFPDFPQEDFFKYKQYLFGEEEYEKNFLRNANKKFK